MVLLENYFVPSKDIFSLEKRSTSDCVVCSGAPSCPTCDDDEECAMTTQTCDSCPKTYCTKLSETLGSSSTNKGLSSAEIGGIAGGISGFAFLMLIIGLYILYRRYKNKNPMDFELAINEEMKHLAGDFDNDTDNEDPGRRKAQQEKRMSQASLSTMANSVLTKASNVINVAYIPGVTIRNARPGYPRSRNSRGTSVYSKDTYFSDLDNASFHGGQLATKAGNPMLVNIDENSYNFDDSYNGDDRENESENINFAGSKANSNTSVFKINKSGFVTGLQHDLIEEEEEEEEEEGEEEKEEKNDKNEENEKIQGDKLGNPQIPIRYGSLMRKNKYKPLESDTDSTTDGSEDSDSDEENIEYLTEQHKQGKLALNEKDSFRSIPNHSPTTATYKDSNINSMETIPVEANQRKDIPLQILESDGNANLDADIDESQTFRSSVVELNIVADLKHKAKNRESHQSEESNENVFLDVDFDADKEGTFLNDNPFESPFDYDYM